MRVLDAAGDWLLADLQVAFAFGLEQKHWCRCLLRADCELGALRPVKAWCECLCKETVVSRELVQAFGNCMAARAVCTGSNVHMTHTRLGVYAQCILAAVQLCLQADRFVVVCNGKSSGTLMLVVILHLPKYPEQLETQCRNY